MKLTQLAAVLFAAFILSRAQAVTIDTVIVDNPSNAPDSTGFGSVSYLYRMGKYEVSNAQYVDFLNDVDPGGSNQLGLYKSFMSLNNNGGILFGFSNPPGAKYSVKLGYDNDPVVFATWYNAVRFANWLHNGQGGPGTTEFGAYTLLGGTPTPSNFNSNIMRNPGALWFIPTENEWYKAAYHQPAAEGGDIDNYWRYPTKTNAVLYSDQPPGTDAPDPSKTANFRADDGLMNGYNDGYAATGSTARVNAHYVTDVGAYTAAVGPYGTYDQGGNAIEWLQNPAPGSFQIGALRGGGWTDDQEILASTTPVSGFRDNEYEYIGFRVAALIPEPSTFALAILSLVAGLQGRRSRSVAIVIWS